VIDYVSSALFSPFRMAGVPLRNRIVMPPMRTNMDLMGDQARAHYHARAAGGVGLVILEATFLDDFDREGFGDSLTALAGVIHAGGAAAVIQLFQPGLIGGERISVSDGSEARPITERELRTLPDRFAAAAATAVGAGFDGVEIHGAHGYFLNQFFSPAHNQRTDGYGGDLPGRMRLGLEITQAVRNRIGQRALLYRHTPVADYPIEDTLSFARALAARGVDVLDISPSTRDGGSHADLAWAVREAASRPVIAVGGMEDPEAAERVLRLDHADLVAIGRGLVADPQLPRKVLEGRRSEVVACIKCNQLCFGNLHAGLPISCAQTIAG
jgi:NADPH2 dehydrogenase